MFQAWMAEHFLLSVLLLLVIAAIIGIACIYLMILIIALVDVAQALFSLIATGGWLWLS